MTDVEMMVNKIKNEVEPYVKKEAPVYIEEKPI